MIVFYNTIILVKDIERSKAFYRDVLGLGIVQDYGTIVFFDNHLTIHNGSALLQTIFGKKPMLNPGKGRKNLEIYFETDDLEGSHRRIAEAGCRIIHGIERQAWGQSVFRFYDPDGHILEIGEAMHLDYLKTEKT